MEIKQLSGEEFLTMYIDRLERSSEQPWYIKGRGKPYAILRPEGISDEEFARLSKIIGGGREYSEIMAGYIASVNAAQETAEFLRARAENPIAREYNGGFSVRSRSGVLTLAFAMKLDSKGADRLLNAAGYDELYVRDARDAGIVFALNSGMDFAEWSEKILPISLSYEGEAKASTSLYLSELRAFVHARERRRDIAQLSITAEAYEDLRAVSGGVSDFEEYLQSRGSGEIIAGRERTRFYCCRELLKAIDTQQAEFFAERERIFAARKPYDRQYAAQILPSLVFGASAKTGESLRFSIQTKSNFAKLCQEEFDNYKVNLSKLAYEFSKLYGGGDNWGELTSFSASGLSSEKLGLLFSGGLCPGRSTFIRLIVLFDSISGCEMPLARLNGMLTASGFAALDMRNVDDCFMAHMLAHRSYEERNNFVMDFLYDLEEEGFSYPGFKLLEGVSRAYPELFGKGD